MRKFTGKKVLLAVVAASFAAVVAMAGCTPSAPTAQSSSSAAASEEAVAAKADVVIGGESYTGESIVLANQTGKTITNIAVSKSGAAADAYFLMADGEQWADGQKAQVNFQPEGDGFYDISIKCGDETYVLHNFMLQGAENIAINLEGNVAYLTLERGGNAISSLADETAWASMTAEEIAAEVEQAPAAEETGNVEGETYVDNSSTYVEPTTTYEAPAAAPAAPAQSEDQCVEGGVVLR